MKVLVFSHVATWPSHHAESVELALTHHLAGHEVVYLSCVGALETCPANPTKRSYMCRVCNMQTKHTTSNVLPKEIKCIDLHVQLVTRSEYKFDSVEALKIFEMHDVPFGLMVYSTLTTELNDSFFDVKEHADKLNRLMTNSIQLYLSALTLFEKEAIDHVFVWNGRRSSEGPLTYAAVALGIKFTTYISGGGYNKILSRENVHTVHDVLAAKKDLQKIVSDLENNVDRFSIVRDAVGFFDFANGSKANKDLNVLGYYQFSQAFEKTDEVLVDKSKNKKVIAVFTGTYSEFAGVPGYDVTNYFCENFYEGVSFLQENVHLLENVELLIRWHPNSRNLNGAEREKLAAIIERGNAIEGVTHITPESNFNTYDLINACDVSVCFGTSVAVESCLYGKPVIFIGHNMFEDLNCFYKPKSFDELISLLNSPLKVKDFYHALAWGYFFSNFGNLEYTVLSQRKPNLFYYGEKRLMSAPLLFRRFLGHFRRGYKLLPVRL